MVTIEWIKCDSQVYSRGYFISLELVSYIDLVCFGFQFLTLFSVDFESECLIGRLWFICFILFGIILALYLNPIQGRLLTSKMRLISYFPIFISLIAMFSLKKKNTLKKKKDLKNYHQLENSPADIFRRSYLKKKWCSWLV